MTSFLGDFSKSQNNHKTIKDGTFLASKFGIFKNFGSTKSGIYLSDTTENCKFQLKTRRKLIAYSFKINIFPNNLPE